MKDIFSKTIGGVLLVIAMFPLAATGQFAFVKHADNTLTITGYTGSGGNVEIPSAIDGFTVTSIGDMAFQSVTSITTLKIPVSVTSIGHNAFAFCTSQTRVMIGSGTTTVGVNAFYGNTSLTNVTIGSRITTLEDGAFQQCSRLTAVNFEGNAPTVVAGNVFAADPVTIYRNGAATGWSSTLAGRPVVIGVVEISQYAPIITGQLTNQAVIVGDTATLTLQVIGSAPLSYHWRKDSLPIVGQTGSSLTVANVKPSDTGRYDVMVSNTFGTVTSPMVWLTVLSLGAPVIQADGESLFEDTIRGDQSTISMSSVFPNGTIFYTTNGSAPDFASTPYSGSFVITQSTTLRAIAYSADFTQSAENGPFQIQIVPTYALFKFVTGQGTIEVYPDPIRHLSGTSVRLIAVPAAGWRFLYWQNDACGSAVDGAVVVMITTKAVTAVFEQIPAYALTASTAGGGTISGNTGSPYLEGSAVTLTAQPSAGWQFLRWEGDASGTTTTVAVTMDRAKNVRAVFGTTVATTVGGSGSLTLTPAQGPYPFGSTVWISARPNVGSYFAVWGSAASGRVNPLPFVVTNANPTVSALFAPLQGSDVNAYVNVNGEGMVSASPNAQPYAPGTSVTLTATPLPGWRFVEWQGEASGTAPTATVVLNVSKTVTAIFELLPRFALSATTPGGGTIWGNTSGTYAEGDVVILTAQPASGWQFLQWEGDASGLFPTKAVTMSQAKNVQAIFGTAMFRNSVGAGALSLDPAQGPYPYGSTVTLTATPNVGSFFAGWGNDASGSENPLGFVVTKANPAICALFSSGQNTAPPSITEQPVSQSVIVGGDASLHVAAGGASPFTYQWRKDGVPFGAASSSTLFLDGVAANGGGAFDVVVANAYGSITSAVATLTVVFPPSITVQPVGQVVAAGTGVTLSVVAGGTEPVAYQWLNSTGAIPNATNATYTIDSASTNDAGDYYVSVANAYGTATSQAATLTVYVPVTFTSQPAQQVVPFKGTAVFSASAGGYPAASYQWLFNGAVVAGANGSSLLVTNVSTNALGGYSVIAWNTYSAATSSVAMLLMSPSIRAPFLGATAVWGKSATLTASAVGSGELSYQWFKDGTAIPSGTSATLMFPTVQLTDAGLYSVVVSSLWGSATNAPAQLVVNPANISLAMYAGVTIDGVAGYTYGIQYSTDLRNTNAWVTATNYTLSIPVETWIDFESAGGLKRFYRVVVP